VTEFLAMGGYGWYVWMSYGACAIAIAGEVLALRARRRRARAEARLASDDAPARQVEAVR
jgi:heme exporter protein D